MLPAVCLGFLLLPKPLLSSVLLLRSKSRFYRGKGENKGDLSTEVCVTASSGPALDGRMDCGLPPFLSLGRFPAVSLPEVTDHLPHEDASVLLSCLHQSPRVARKRG